MLHVPLAVVITGHPAPTTQHPPTEQKSTQQCNNSAELAILLILYRVELGYNPETSDNIKSREYVQQRQVHTTYTTHIAH